MRLCRYAVILYTFTDISVDVGSFKTIAVFSWPSCFSYTAVCGETMLHELWFVLGSHNCCWGVSKQQITRRSEMCFLFWCSLIFFICPSGFFVQTSWGNLKLCGVAVIDMCWHILWIAGFHWLRFLSGGTRFHCLSRLCLMKITPCVAPHNLCGMSVGRAPLDFCNLACCARPSLLGWRHVYDCAAILMINLHRGSATCWHTVRCCSCMKTWVCAKNISKKQNTWQSLGERSDTYHLGDYCSGFLCFNSKYKWLHLCLDGMA